MFFDPIQPVRVPLEGRLLKDSTEIRCMICKKTQGTTYDIGGTWTTCSECSTEMEQAREEIDKKKEYKSELGESLERMRERGDDDIYDSSTYHRWSELGDEIREMEKEFSDKFYH